MKKRHLKLVHPPKESKIIRNKWVFRKKMKIDRSLNKYKSRVGYKGFQQTKEVD